MPKKLTITAVQELIIVIHNYDEDGDQEASECINNGLMSGFISGIATKLYTLYEITQIANLIDNI